MAPVLTTGTNDEVRAIDESEVPAMARRLPREDGISGVSTSLNVVAALRLAEELGSGRTAATVAVDIGLEYLAGDPHQA